MKKSTTFQTLESIKNELNAISKSGYIPFASPCPSSTENDIKNSIIEAMRLIDKVMYLHSQCYSEPIAHIC